MPELKAFRAWTYHPSKKSELDQLISPPYDVISETERQNLLRKNPLNSVKLSLVDSQSKSPYEDMAKEFKNWKSSGVLEQQKKPAFYLIEEKYEVDGVAYTRVGFVGLLRVSDFSKKEVLPHEYTLKGPKADRLQLLKTMGAELSQIFFVYEDPERLVDQIYQRLSQTEALLKATDLAGVARQVWLIDSPEEIEKIRASFKDRPVLIADGHHRYETAIQFSKDQSGEASQYVQSYFLNSKSSGFQIRPIHRIATLSEGMDAEQLMTKLKLRFSMEEASIEQMTSLSKDHQPSSQVRLGMILGSNIQSGFLLSRQKKSEEDAEIFSLQKDIFEEMIGWTVQQIAEKKVVNYHHEITGLLDMIKDQPQKIGFILPPTDLALIQKLALRGERMPQKSSFFFPKIASGLLIYELGSF
jgi:uncharacterized protein (DUF1015 family)